MTVQRGSGPRDAGEPPGALRWAAEGSVAPIDEWHCPDHGQLARYATLRGSGWTGVAVVLPLIADAR